ncbi:MAG: hypothetical protein ACMXX7_03020 [Candidatus Woesearchaeota archaeon]
MEIKNYITKIKNSSTAKMLPLLALPFCNNNAEQQEYQQEDGEKTRIELMYISPKNDGLYSRVLYLRDRKCPELTSPYKDQPQPHDFLRRPNLHTQFGGGIPLPVTRNELKAYYENDRSSREISFGNLDDVVQLCMEKK